MIAPSILVFDSGLGGLSVLRALRETLPNAPLLYVADTAAFPYGNRSAQDICKRASSVISAMERQHAIGLVVIACNTLSTLCLGALRSLHAIPFVGTVPAIKVAAARSLTKRFTLLATPNTADSTYSNDLIATFAKGCHVDCVGAPHLASIAERFLLEGTLSLEQVSHDIAPCFHDDAQGRTDMLVLGCTHYPFLAEAIRAVSPWDVALIDPALAIAQQAGRLWNGQGAMRDAVHHAFVTRASDQLRYDTVFTRFGFSSTGTLQLAQAA